MYVLKLKGDLVWQTAGPDKSEDPLEFELEALLSKRPAPLHKQAEVSDVLIKGLLVRTPVGPQTYQVRQSSTPNPLLT